MTIILRRVGSTTPMKLRKCGICNLSLAWIVGVMPSKGFRVVWLSDYTEN